MAITNYWRTVKGLDSDETADDSSRAHSLFTANIRCMSALCVFAWTPESLSNKPLDRSLLEVSFAEQHISQPSSDP
jgi:hypothetical protein